MLFKYFLLCASFLPGLSLFAMEQPSKKVKHNFIDLNDPNGGFSYSDYSNTGKVQAHSSDQDFPESQLLQLVQPIPESSDKLPNNSAQNSTLSPLPFLNQPVETASQGLNQTASIKKQKKCAVCDMVVLNLNLHEKTGTHKKNIKRFMGETKKLLTQLSKESEYESQEFSEDAGQYYDSDYTDTDADTEVYNPILIPWDQIEDKTSLDTFDGAHFLNTLYAITAQYRELSMATEQTSHDMDQDGSAKNNSGKLYKRKTGLNTERKFTFSFIGQQCAQSNTQSSVSNS